MGKVYAYGRITTENQEKDIRTTMLEMQVPEEHIYIDIPQKNKKTFPQYAKLVRKLDKDDVLYISRLADLGGGYTEIKEQWRILTNEKKADIIVLEIPQLDTRKGKAQYGFLVADVVYSILDYVTDKDKNVRKSRQREGIAEAKQKGIKFGRPPKQMPGNFTQIYNRWVSKEITATEAADLCGVSRTMFYKKVGEIQKKMEWEQENFSK